MYSEEPAMRRLVITGLVPLAAALILSGCNGGADGWADKPGPKVLAFFPPLYSLAATVAGDDAQVQSLLTTKGPHDYEARTSDARRLRRADLFLTIGLGLDDSVAKKLADTCGNKSLRLVELGEKLPKEMLRKGACSCGHEHEHS